MIPELCDDQCHAKRVHMYMFYSIFLGALLLLALIHFIFFISTRRKSKYEAKEYATRKQEFVTLGISDLLTASEKEAHAGGESNKQSSDEEGPPIEHNHNPEMEMTPREPLASSSSSTYNRILNGIDTGPMQRIDEESMAAPRNQTLMNGCSSSSSTASTLRGRTTMGSLHEPVIVTVATVSALFQQQEMDEAYEQQQQQHNRPHSDESMSSVDISDLVNSPGRSSAVVKSDGGDEQSGVTGDWRNEPVRDRKRDVHTHNHPTLEVRGRGGIGGFLRSHREGPPLREDSMSTDVIFPASGPGGFYDTDHIT